MPDARLSPAVLNARYIAIRTAEAKGLTGRLLEAARDRTPGVRPLLVPILYRFWHRNREEGWALLEQIAGGAVRFPGLPDGEAFVICVEVSMPILNACRLEPDQLARFVRIWQALMASLFHSPLARTGRVLARKWILKAVAMVGAEIMKRQPAYQLVNFNEFTAMWARPDAFRQSWRIALEGLEKPEAGFGGIEAILSRADLTYDLYLMLVCERALIYQGAREPAAVFDLVVRLFHAGCPWFRQSIFYILFYVLGSQPALEEGWLDRYDALAIEFFTSGSWRLETAGGSYNCATMVANPDVIAARNGRPPRVVPALLERAIAAGDEAEIAGLFAAIDGIAFYHCNGSLALALIERAYELAGRADSRVRRIVEERAQASLASVRLQEQPLVDDYLAQHRVFADISPSYLSGIEPSIGEADLLTLIDGFIVHMMLTSDAFRAQICGAFRRALDARSVREGFAQIFEWVRDELLALPRSA